LIESLNKETIFEWS